MCGIAGVFTRGKNRPVSVELLKNMIGIMRYRGPDEAGIYVDDRIGLAQVRLSIIDLAGGSQPISNEDRTKWVIFNGEIFNYPELREDLEKRGHRFSTNTDTEVIIHQYEEDGVACVDKFNGQFAFALWDTAKGELFLARDRVGIRPLHYCLHNGSFYFASEVKALFMEPSIPRAIDPEAIDQCATFWTTLPGKTFFKDIFELPPGHSMVVRQSSMQMHRYWEIPYFSREHYFKEDVPSLCERVQALLVDAIRIRLRADVPVASYLSGGLDSSGITGLITRHFNNDLTTFGIRFEEESYDEGTFQQEAAAFLGVHHHELHATNRAIAESFPSVIWHCEKPLLRTAPVPLFLLSSLVREKGLKVVVTGEGADEIFGGYNIFREALVRNFIAREPASPMRAQLLKRLYPYIFTGATAQRSMQLFFGRQLQTREDPLFSHQIRWNNTARIKQLFTGDFAERMKGYDGFAELIGWLPPDFPKRPVLTRAQHLEILLFLSNYLLSSQGDRVAMAHSVEMRLPYLDFRVIECMAQISPMWKILGLNEKHLLKRIYSGVLPKNIVERPKHPYRAPIKSALFCTAPDARYLMDFITEEAIAKTAIFDHRRVSMLMRKCMAEPLVSEVDGMAAVAVVSTQLIHHQFIDRFPYQPAAPIECSRFIDKRTRT